MSVAERWLGDWAHRREAHLEEYRLMLRAFRRDWLGVFSLLVIIAVAIGTPLGAIAGYSGRRLDEVIMRITEALWDFAGCSERACRPRRTSGDSASPQRHIRGRHVPFEHTYPAKPGRSPAL